MIGSGQVVLPDVREWSGGPPGCLGVVGRPSQMSGSGRESLPDVWGGREALPDVWGGQEALLHVRKWLGVLPGCPGVVGRSSRMPGSGREAFSDVR